MTPFWAEIVGTAILIVFGGGVCAAMNLHKAFAKGAGWINIAFGWGFAVAFGIYAVGNISGAHLNPAVTIGLASTGQFAWGDVPSYIIAQFIGAMLGAAIVYLAYLPHWGATKDTGTKLGVFSTGPAIPHTFSNMLSEIVGTFMLVFCIAAIGTNNIADGLNPLLIGFLIVALGLSLGSATGYALNPARDLGPRIMHALLPIPGKGRSNWGYSWIPVVGPIIGGVLGSSVHQAAFLGNITPALWISLVAVALVIIGAFVTGGNTVAVEHETTTLKKAA
ncbi:MULTISPECIES: MIP/aquaporin family protein [Bacillus]|uniref:MIP/aquaporin family protein n=1 Tax=Bacillus TaxID=1386 RepID=UPI0002FC9249|nr:MULTISPECIES: MIP/aquaporin family protein [Bacillus]